MTLCNEWTLVKDLGQIRYAKPLPCRSWNCESCAEMRRAQLMAQAASGEPVRFLTLTVNPEVGSDPEDRMKMLAWAWRTCVKRLRRRYGPQAIEFLAIVEQTKLGEPHLHILLRSPYIPQAYISECMADLINAPIVDIRLIRNQREVVRYVAKYLTKAPHRFGTSKRYWCSAHYDLGKEDFRKNRPAPIVKWAIAREPISLIINRWIHEHFAVRRDKGTTLIGIYTTYEMQQRE